jgi:hypothetical protein
MSPKQPNIIITTPADEKLNVSAFASEKKLLIKLINEKVDLLQSNIDSVSTKCLSIEEISKQINSKGIQDLEPMLAKK